MNPLLILIVILNLRVCICDDPVSKFQKSSGQSNNAEGSKLQPNVFEHLDHSHLKSENIKEEPKFDYQNQDANQIDDRAFHPRSHIGSSLLPATRRIENTVVNCQKNHMIVTFEFSSPFGGYIYPYEQFLNCILFSGHNSYESVLTLHHGVCGQTQILNQNEPDFSAIIEHRLMIQWERDFMSEDDSSVIVRCDRPDDFNKTVSWNLGTLDLDTTIKRSNHPGPRTWMEIQRGEGPYAPPLDGKPVFIGDVLTIVFTLSDDVFWFGSNILACNAADGGDRVNGDQERGVILSPAKSFSREMNVIENECSTKPKLFSHILKERVTRDGNLITIHYAHFKAFRFPTSSKLVLQCEVQVCYKDCEPLPPCSTGFQPRAAVTQPRQKRSPKSDEKFREGSELDTVDLFRTIEVYSAEDGALKEIPVQAVRAEEATKERIIQELMSSYCYSSGMFYGWVTILGSTTLFLLIILIWCQSRKNNPKMMTTPKH